MDEAEERTLYYYRIPPHRWQQMKYDLVTRQDREWEPFPETALARVQRLKHVHPILNSAYDFYRIHLNDSGILTAARRERLGRDLYPFLVYILTHEMVHLVRLTTILPEEEESYLSVEEEEKRVQNVAFRILSAVSDQSLGLVLSRFCPVASPVRFLKRSDGQ